VSSILNALKKLENEMAQQSSLLKEINPKKTIRRKSMGTWLFYSLISALFTAAILIGGGWLILQQKPALMKLLSPSAEKKSEVPRSMAAKKQDMPPTPAPVLQTPPVKILNPPAQPLPAKPAVPDVKEEIIILPKKKVERAPQPIQEEIPQAAPPIRDDSAEIAKIEQEIEQAIKEEPKEEIKKPDTLRAPDKADTAPEKQIQGLSIQALVWSVDPQRRMAVINSQIVHIGDMLNNFRIKDIGSDYVILQEGGQDWKMKFQIN
jgi:hypothetical protein